MFRFTSLVLLLMNGISAEWCYDSVYKSYYCSPGQTCGSFYGDCRGLPTYVIISIIFISLILLMICIRCCIQLNSNNTSSVRNSRLAQTQVHPFTVIQEDAPPSYAVATSSTAGLPKY